MSTTITAQRIENHLPSPAIEVLPAEIAEQMNTALALVPAKVDDATMDAADKASAELHRLEKDVEKRRKELTKPITELKKAIDDCCKSVTAPVSAARGTLNRQIGAHLAAKEAERQEAIRKAEAERRRIEEDQRKAEEAAAAEAAEEAEASGGLFDGIADSPAPKPAPVAQAPATYVAPPPKSGSVVIKQVKVLKITDAEAIPRSYMNIDEPRIRKALLEGIAVPGAELVEESQVAQRGSR